MKNNANREQKETKPPLTVASDYNTFVLSIWLKFLYVQ